MKKYIIFGLTLLMAFPLSVVAQDEDTEEESLHRYTSICQISTPHVWVCKLLRYSKR